jgi:hypothetical protein
LSIPTRQARETRKAARAQISDGLWRSAAAAATHYFDEHRLAAIARLTIERDFVMAVFARWR